MRGQELGRLLLLASLVVFFNSDICSAQEQNVADQAALEQMTLPSIFTELPATAAQADVTSQSGPVELTPPADVKVVNAGPGEASH